MRVLGATWKDVELEKSRLKAAFLSVGIPGRSLYIR